MGKGLQGPHLTQASLEMLLYPKPAPLPSRGRVVVCKYLFFLLQPFLEIQDLYCGYFPIHLMPRASL